MSQHITQSTNLNQQQKTDNQTLNSSQNQDQTKNNESKDPSQTSLLFKILVCVGYAFFSSLMSIVNKTLFNQFKIKSPVTLLLVQCTCNIVICSAMFIYKEFNLKAFRSLDNIQSRVPTMSEALSKYSLGFKLSSLNIMALFLSLYGSKILSIPLQYLAILNNVLDFQLSEDWDSFDTNWFGYFVVLMTNILGAAYSVYSNKVNSEKKLITFGVFFAIGYLILTGNIDDITNAFQNCNSSEMKLEFLVYLFLSGIMGIVIQLTNLMMVTLVDSLAPNFTGSLRDVALSYAGQIFFREDKMSFLMAFGLFINFIGALIYPLDQYRIRQRNLQRVGEKQKQN
ncbi:UNKNOWN [Stylonychia lemnae]|uniref:Uncharacterized protein n=1 Tax=Stylonychia lemnae TaxID=5949 RepID=A0A078AQK2_STYLE|nr:UNKNOWN [Stylonychia lemnae]|eukprot:CDW83527.1 UNKNOWN [Stylonychia lemnae]